MASEKVLASIESAWIKTMYAPLKRINQPMAEALQNTVHLNGELLGNYLMNIYRELLKGQTSFAHVFETQDRLERWYKRVLNQYENAKKSIIL